MVDEPHELSGEQLAKLHQRLLEMARLANMAETERITRRLFNQYIGGLSIPECEMGGENE